ncbi:unnamed protein product [Peniophora sp. CBMAI 1063]|nr:unnamed protein product [Peniophora sp. CBMAI 1063]
MSSLLGALGNTVSDLGTALGGGVASVGSAAGSGLSGTTQGLSDLGRNTDRGVLGGQGLSALGNGRDLSHWMRQPPETGKTSDDAPPRTSCIILHLSLDLVLLRQC